MITAFAAIIFTQLIKYPIAQLTNKKSASIDLVTSTGGMPSSHSAAVSSLITALTLEHGFDSPLVAIATVFGVIVMFDSMGVRRQSGEQGIVLDILARHHLAELSALQRENITQAANSKLNPVIDDYEIDDYKHMIINKYLGHKPTEVIVGVITGFTVALFIRMTYYYFFS
ncbi:divergent PAP2 family protein [Vaginisenegalia massiliensis]|uniref:divergent PAP2 family protein n=1 Tax=Vaginisenegalia massiliensis TaxID=2058294 RepID=UPI0030B928A5